MKNIEISLTPSEFRLMVALLRCGTETYCPGLGNLQHRLATFAILDEAPKADFDALAEKMQLVLESHP